MKIGVCCSLDQAEAALRAGADYLEVAGGRLATDPEYRKALKGMPVEASNLFFSGIDSIYADPQRSIDHGEAVLVAGAELGVQVAVIGSGAARRAPTGRTRGDAEAEFVSIVARIAETPSGVRIPVAPESLQREETDVGNDLGRMALALQSAGVGFTADSYHVLKEWNFEGREDGLELPSYGFLANQIPHLPLHVHFAPLTREPPRPDDPMLHVFVQRLKTLGYQGRVSLECNWTNFESEIRPALKAARELWQ